jgi:hypothetical protein
MRFGIVVTEQNQGAHATALLQAALRQGWQVRCFLTENAVNLLRDPAFVGLSGEHEQLHLSACEHSMERYCHDIDADGLKDTVVVGGQYQNAELVRNSDRVLVF